MKGNLQLQKMKKDQQAMRYQSISTDLDLALTFVNIAHSTDGKHRSRRNLNHAQKASQHEHFLRKDPLLPKCARNSRQR